MATLRELRESLVEISRRHSRVAHEAEDVAHDLVLSALLRDLPLEGESFLQRAHGAARRHAAFLARSAGRRRAREAHCALVDMPDMVADPAKEAADGAAPLSILSPALRTTLLLLMLGLDKAELRVALGLNDTALRKRFQELRARGPLARPLLHLARRTPALSRLRRSQVELLPRLTATPAVGEAAQRALAVSDPDGHGLIFAEVLTPSRGAATRRAASRYASPPTKGIACSTAKSKT